MWSTIITALANILGPLALYLVKTWVESMQLKKDQLKNYYAFLEDIDQHTKIDVANYVAAGDAREETIKRIREKRTKREAL